MSPLQRQFDEQWAPYRNEPQVLVACSGGPDSVALLCLLRQSHCQPHGLTVAHFNHQLRNQHSELDARFVEDLCRHLAIRCEIGHADPRAQHAGSRGEGLESAARKMRYEFLSQTAQRLGARYLVTGHTADDQVETVLHHVLRGTGLAGLAGMAAVRALGPAVSLVRPMLSFTRTQILDDLRERRQAYRLDEHNQQREFVRSRIRCELLPLLESEYYAGIRESLRKLSRVAADAQNLIQNLAESLLDQSLVVAANPTWQLDRRVLATAPEHLCREAFVCFWQRQAWPLQDMTFEHWQQLATMSRADTDKATRDFPGGVRVRREHHRLILHRSPSS